MRYSPPAASAVRENLERVLSSQTFRRSERARSLIAYLVEREQAGESARLKGYTIGVDVFGKDQEFDSSADAAVRVQVGRLRELLAQYYRAEGRADPIRIVIPLGSYVPVYEPAPRDAGTSGRPAPRAGWLALAGGSFLAIQSFAKAMRPRTRLDRWGGGAGVMEVRLLWTALALVTTLLVVVAYRTVQTAPAPGATEVATGGQVPAATVPEAPDAEALPTIRIVKTTDSPAVAGVAALFRTALAGFETINLIGGEYWDKSHKQPVDAAGFVLSVAPTVLEGGVLVELQSLGSGRVLINRRLSAADIAPRNLEARVADLVNAIVPANGVIYGYLKQKGLLSALANCLVLNNAFYVDWTERRHFAAYRCFEKLADAHARSPVVYASLGSLRVAAKTEGFAYPLDPSDEETMAMLRRAVQIAPTNSYVYRAMGYFYSQTSHKAEAAGWMRRAYEFNTFDLPGAAAYGYALVFSGNYRESAAVLQRAIDASTVHPSWWDYCLFLARFMTGDMERAWKAASGISTLNEWQYVAARLIAARAQGDEQRADDLVALLASSYPKFVANPEAVILGENYPPELAARLVDALRTAGIAGAG